MRKVQVFRGRRAWHYRVLALNGEVVGQSEGYVSRWNAIRAAKKNTDATVIEVYNRQFGLVRTIDR